MPERPGSGLAGALDPEPDPLPPAADPFVPNPTTSVYDQYGYAGLTWHTYDLGCGGSVRDPAAATDTMIGNVLLSIAVWLTAATNGLHNNVADPASYMRPLDQVVATVTARLHEAIWSPWGAVAVLGVAALLLFQAMRGPLPRGRRGCGVGGAGARRRGRHHAVPIQGERVLRRHHHLEHRLHPGSHRGCRLIHPARAVERPGAGRAHGRPRALRRLAARAARVVRLARGRTLGPGPVPSQRRELGRVGRGHDTGRDERAHRRKGASVDGNRRRDRRSRTPRRTRCCRARPVAGWATE